MKHRAIVCTSSPTAQNETSGAEASRRPAPQRRSKALVSGLVAWCLGLTLSSASLANPDGPVDLSQYGIFYDRYEPSFYTGFAPRAKDPKRLHLHVGRGNQLRMTLVLSDAVINEYAGDLLARYRTYRGLIDEGQVILTQNAGFKDFEQTILDLDLDGLITEQAGLTPGAARARNLALMEKLNPGRVFRIKIPTDRLIEKWASALTANDRKSMPKKRQLELLNLLLPTRLWIAELNREDAKDLKRLAE